MKGSLPVLPTRGPIARVLVALACTAGVALGVPAPALASAPSASTLIAFSTGTTTATVEGVVNPGGQTTHYQGAYGLASSEWCTSGGSSGTPEHKTTLETLGYTEPHFSYVEVSLSGLSAGTKYCAEVVAENGAGTKHGGQVGFTAGAPTAFTLEAISLTETTVSLAGYIDAAGQTTHFRVKLGLASSTWCKTEGSSGTAGYTSPAFAFGYTNGEFHIAAVELSGVSAERATATKCSPKTPRVPGTVDR